jgi:hypothetical protein
MEQILSYSFFDWFLSLYLMVAVTYGGLFMVTVEFIYDEKSL